MAGELISANTHLHRHKWRVPLGSCSAVALSKAREAAAAVMGDVAKGRNPAIRAQGGGSSRAREAHAQSSHAPSADRRLEPASPCQPASELRHGGGARAALAFADRLDDAAEDLDRTAVLRALDALTRAASPRRATAEQAQGCRYDRPHRCLWASRIGWAVKRGAVRVNPFAGLPIDKSIAKRERVLSDQELAEVWRAAGDALPPYSTIVRLLILTGQRRGEVAGMTWGELSDDLTTWSLPGERTKNGVPHTVPLSERARHLLKAVQRQRQEPEQRPVGQTRVGLTQ